MAEIVRMPKLSDTMTEGTVAVWHKKVGDKVKSGELLAEIETDKATMEFESYEDGILLHIGVEKGKTAPVDSILAIFGKEGEDISALLAGEQVPAAQPAAVSAPAVQQTAPAPAAAPVAAVAVAKVAEAVSNNGRLKASPLARKIAEEKGVDIAAIAGSGDGGRIVRRDVESYTPGQAAAAKSAAAPTFVAAGTENYNDVVVSQMRKAIARRLTDSKLDAPHFYLTMDIDMDNAIAVRKAIVDSGSKVSFNDMVLKAAAMALKKHPAVNASWRGDFIRYNEHVHVGVAVAVDDGLFVPVVRFANEKGLVQISAEVKDYAERAKSRKLQPTDWEGSTFTISNLGMFGIESFTAIINPPDACIMAIGGIKQIPVVKNGQVVPGNVMKVSLSCDHRVVDGAAGASFLQTFKAYLENPVLMLA
jgi:pyruvate dehydrogenase E2 component (dihydrolipoamide acetyltransferase)